MTWGKGNDSTATASALFAINYHVVILGLLENELILAGSRIGGKEKKGRNYATYFRKMEG